MQLHAVKEVYLGEPKNDAQAFETFVHILTHKNIWIPPTAQKCVSYLDLILLNNRIPSELKTFINDEIKTLFIFLSFRSQKEEIESPAFKSKFQLAINAVIYNLQEYYK